MKQTVEDPNHGYYYTAPGTARIKINQDYTEVSVIGCSGFKDPQSITNPGKFVGVANFRVRYYSTYCEWSFTNNSISSSVNGEIIPNFYI